MVTRVIRNYAALLGVSAEEMLTQARRSAMVLARGEEAMTIYRYNGFYHDGEGWLALMGTAEWTRDELMRASFAETGEQRAEIEKAIAALPADDVKPTSAQRRKIEPAE